MGAAADWSRNFGGAAAAAVEVYDEVLVPRMFTPWGEALLDGLDVGAGDAVLDVACGPGTVARLAAARVGAGGRVVGCDLSPTMLERAAGKPGDPGAAVVQYLQGPAEVLPVEDGAFDVATCQHGLQFFPDRPAALAELQRALRPGGRVGVAVWTAVEASPPFEAVADGIGAVLGPEPRAAYAGGPWALPDAVVLSALATDAGFEDVRVSTQTRPVVFDTPGQLTSTVLVAPLGARLTPDGGAAFDAVVAAVAERLGDGPIASTLEAHVLLATAR